MDNTFMDAMKGNSNYTLTENLALTHRSTMSKLYDLFSLGAAYRSRSDEDCILLFKNAFEENALLALKCLFYLRAVRGGQGERRFFRVVMHWLANNYPDVVRKNIENIVHFGRVDDLYTLVDTPVEPFAFKFIENQLMLDLQSKTPSLCAKWLKSENCSSAESRRLGQLTRQRLNLTAREYRKMLSKLREKLRIVERYMSANEWEKIEYDKVPSRAGLIYRNAFARHDIERLAAGKRTYESFIKDENTKVNAGVLYPYEVVKKAMTIKYWDNDETNRCAVNKYWDNLTDYFKGASFNGIAVVDTSASMLGTPMNVAISLGLYCAEHNKGPFAGHYISFSSHPRFVATEGIDFVDKVHRIRASNLVSNTNIEATFDLLLMTAIRPDVRAEDIPKNLIIISDMEFDAARGYYYGHDEPQTLMEKIKIKWEAHGLKMPNLIFWNVDARQNNIPMRSEHGITFVSGFSPVIFQQIIEGKTAEDLMLSVLNSQMYERVII